MAIFQAWRRTNVGWERALSAGGCTYSSDTFLVSRLARFTWERSRIINIARCCCPTQHPRSQALLFIAPTIFHKCPARRCRSGALQRATLSTWNRQPRLWAALKFTPWQDGDITFWCAENALTRRARKLWTSGAARPAFRPDGIYGWPLRCDTFAGCLTGGDGADDGLSTNPTWPQNEIRPAWLFRRAAMRGVVGRAAGRFGFDFFISLHVPAAR